MHCDIQLTCNNVTIKAEEVSRLHFGLKRNNRATLLEDYSTNGTYVNSLLIGKGNSQFLKHLDVISLTSWKDKVFMYLETSYISTNYPIEIQEKFIIANILGKGYYSIIFSQVLKYLLF